MNRYAGQLIGWSACAVAKLSRGYPLNKKRDLTSLTTEENKTDIYKHKRTIAKLL